MSDTKAPRCYVCGTTMREEATTYCQVVNGHVRLFENVPAWVCPRCGAQSFQPAVSDEISRIAEEEPAPTRLMTIPVYDLTDGRLAEPAVAQER